MGVHPQFELDCMNTFSRNRRKPFSVILWPQEGENVAKKRINSEHLSNKCTHQVWIGVSEYFFR